MKKGHFLFLALGLFAVLWYVLFPALGFQLDDDCTAYLQMTDELVKGHWDKAFNSLWSPLNQWVLFPLVKWTRAWGWTTFYTAQVLNAIFGGLVLVETHLFLRKRNLSIQQHGGFLLVLAPVLVYYAFLQTFGDLLQLLFVIPALHLLLQEDFVRQLRKWLLFAILMGVASYAKSFNGPFFFVFIAFFLLKLLLEKRVTKREALLRLVLSYVVMGIVLMPATLGYHAAYGSYTPFGFSGKLNMSWLVNGHKSFKDGITYLIPPAYDGAHSLWDDPMRIHGALTTPFSSAYYFAKYVAKVMLNVLTALRCLWELNLFFLILAIVILWRKKREALLEKGFWKSDVFFFSLTLLVLYVSVHIEARYLLIVLIAAPILWSELLKKEQLARLYPWLLGACLLFPSIDTVERWHKNEVLFKEAAVLKAHHIEGRITSNAYKSGPSWVVAYLNDNAYYTLEKFDVSIDDYLAELQRYHIQYFIDYHEAPHWQLLTMDMDAFQEVCSTKEFTVYKLKFTKP